MFKHFYLVCLLILFVSCKGGGDAKTELANIDNSTEWTIFIYGHADHNLTPSMIVDYQEMLAANLSSRVKVILAVDLDDSRLGSSLGTTVYEILGNGNSNLLSSSSEENFDDPAVLEAHMMTAFSSFPSKKRGVILWDHGGSWDGGFGGDHQNGTVSS